MVDTGGLITDTFVYTVSPGKSSLVTEWLVDIL